MTFADVIENMQDGQAAKRPSWGGYVRKDVLTTDQTTGEPLTWEVTFVTRGSAGESTAPDSGNTNRLTDDEGTYSFLWNGTAWVAPDDSQTTMDALAIDGQLFAALVAYDWDITTAAEAEQARTGTGNRW